MNKQKHVMLDIETLGKRPGSVIWSIGAVKFDESGLGASFYHVIDIQSALDEGLTIDGSTLLWWMKQDEAARAEMWAPAVSLPQALGDFKTFLADGEYCVWGNGASFDNALLAEAYHLVGYEPPWKYKHERCYRTLRALCPDATTREEGDLVYHRSLDDATSQARNAIGILRRLKGLPDAEGEGPPVSAESGPAPARKALGNVWLMNNAQLLVFDEDRKQVPELQSPLLINLWAERATALGYDVDGLKIKKERGGTITLIRQEEGWSYSVS